MGRRGLCAAFESDVVSLSVLLSHPVSPTLWVVLLTERQSSDLPQEEVSGKMDDVRATIRKAQEGYVQAMTATGAEIWLVSTHLDIDDWKPVARRKVEDAQWSWEV